MCGENILRRTTIHFSTEWEFTHLNHHSDAKFLRIHRLEEICCYTVPISLLLPAIFQHSLRLIAMRWRFFNWGRLLLNVNKSFLSDLQRISVISIFNLSSTGSHKCIGLDNCDYAHNKPQKHILSHFSFPVICAGHHLLIKDKANDQLI